MTLLNPAPSRGRAEQLQLRPRARFFVDFRRGTAEAITGQPFSFFNIVLNRNSIASNGVPYTNGLAVPILSFTPGGIGLTGRHITTYSGVNPQLRIAQRPVLPFQIAWHGMIPTTIDVTPVLFQVGSSLFPFNRILLRCNNDGVFGQYTGNGVGTIFTPTVKMVRQQECFVVLQFVPDGANNVRIRLAVKRRVAFDDPPWEISDLSASIACHTEINDSVLELPALSTDSDDQVIYRVLFQDGTNSEEDLPWGWTARRDGLPGTYGLTENGFIQLVLDAGNQLYFRDDDTYVSIDTDPPTDYLALEPGGPASPYIYLETLV